ncbi:hypothetical protein BAE44_0001979 [Dichanthelium oligosanthes]|uniref:F-box domain-containing protein n=1 Tax=Dichanthelium oligosanthes TaxID=888268 RepID=A0A1E5WI46_9POAL|nr:hypothetical protein BAE44_0001979 [Dichanthelium oligosanthes]
MEVPPRSLTDDVLEEDVLRRLPPRALAVCSCVCKAWRAAIDARHTLRPDLLPLTLGGIFISVARVPEPLLFLAPPSMSRRVQQARELRGEGRRRRLGCIPMIFGCCNSLLLLAEHGRQPGH